MQNDLHMIFLGSTVKKYIVCPSERTKIKSDLVANIIDINLLSFINLKDLLLLTLLVENNNPKE